ncbi:MAG TPA: c-type cytochrome [Bacteroidetes bacterium]|nr:c-type cytochrome [Bacteroidota bacterium]
MRIGPKLSDIGDKPLSEFDFGHSQIPGTRGAYIFEKIKNPRAFATADHPQKMPLFKLTNSDIYDLTLLLLSFNQKKISSPLFMAFPDTSLYRPQGEFGRLVEKFQCFSCHRINGRGFNLAYDLSIEGSRVSRQWLYDYLMVSYSLRPILVERMPIFNFTPQEAKTITDHIMANYTSGWIPRHPGEESSPQLIVQGKQLVKEKGCLACHILGDKGGYVAPSFTTGALAGDKLQAEWIYRWLKDPQKIVHGVLEPNYGLSDREALAITAYLMTLNHKDWR